MKIDTVHGAGGSMRVTIVLKTRHERSLSDDDLIRIGLNQHLLNWPDCESGEAELGAEDPKQFEITDNWTSRVLRDPAANRAIVIYRDLDEQEDDASGLLLRLAVKAGPVAFAAGMALSIRAALILGLVDRIAPTVNT